MYECIENVKFIMIIDNSLIWNEAEEHVTMNPILHSKWLVAKILVL